MRIANSEIRNLENLEICSDSFCLNSVGVSSQWIVDSPRTKP